MLLLSRFLPVLPYNFPRTESQEASQSYPWQFQQEGEELCGRPRYGEDRRSYSPMGGAMLKVLQGKEALPGAFPWQVAILDEDRVS